jgi:hypothetical protein
MATSMFGFFKVVWDVTVHALILNASAPSAYN